MATSSLLLESGSFLLLEDGVSHLLLQNSGSSDVTTIVVDNSDGNPRRPRNGDEELTEAEVQFMHRKIAELKNARTELEKLKAAKAIEIALAQAAQDDEVAEVITATIQEKRPTADYGAVMRDVALLSQIAGALDKIVKEAAAERRRLDDEDDIETLLMVL